MMTFLLSDRPVLALVGGKKQLFGGPS